VGGDPEEVLRGEWLPGGLIRHAQRKRGRQLTVHPHSHLNARHACQIPLGL